MSQYNGNKIYEYVHDHDLDYVYSASFEWLLIYGDKDSTPKLFAYVCDADNSKISSQEKKRRADRAFHFSRQLALPFVYIRFKKGKQEVLLGQSEIDCFIYRKVSYAELKTIFEQYGVSEAGTVEKEVNQYLSSSYHDWQRTSLGNITVSDLDMIKIDQDDNILEILELKRSKYPLDSWKPYRKDFSNFALIMNAIVNSGKKIPFKLFYNLMSDGQKGKREEDIRTIKVFEFEKPDDFIGANEVRYSEIGQFPLEELL